MVYPKKFKHLFRKSTGFLFVPEVGSKPRFYLSARLKHTSPIKGKNHESIAKEYSFNWILDESRAFIW